MREQSYATVKHVYAFCWCCVSNRISIKLNVQSIIINNLIKEKCFLENLICTLENKGFWSKDNLYRITLFPKSNLIIYNQWKSSDLENHQKVTGLHVIKNSALCFIELSWLELYAQYTGIRKGICQLQSRTY